MEKLTNIIADVQGRRDVFSGQLADVEGNIMEAVAEHDDVLSDRNIDAIAHTSALASKLFTLAHDLALGLSVDSVETQQQVREALVALSELADQSFLSEDEDDDGTWDRA
ncbi:hypothetical protein [Aminobacter sp. BE322]|uniref:hypothetical protein n=1 Tax=unclassified Aminobacter TaxID=2644704 RepID=UPI003D1C4295